MAFVDKLKDVQNIKITWLEFKGREASYASLVHWKV